ncbi:PLC-like phosphodiesterase [Hyaloraphidium curvatum]|nr:PLC-like phosphodiesterase [Hyaloraphidium curvatum]
MAAIAAVAVSAGLFAWTAYRTRLHLSGSPGQSADTPEERLERWKALAIVAHRGANKPSEGAAIGPENTLRAYRLALESGADGIECDLGLTKDDRLVAMHDSTVDRTTGSKGRLRDLTLEEVRKLDASGAAREGDPPPTMEEIVELLADFPLAEVHFDLKPSSNDPELTMRRIREALQAFALAHASPDPFERVLLNCWRDDYHEAAVRILPECRRISLRLFAPDFGSLSFFDGVVLGSLFERTAGFARTFVSRSEKGDDSSAGRDSRHQSDVFGYSIQANVLGFSPSFARRAKRRGYRTQVWTVQDRHGLVRAVDWLGAGCVLTDRPALLVALKKEIVAELEALGVGPPVEEAALLAG